MNPTRGPTSSHPNLNPSITPDAHQPQAITLESAITASRAIWIRDLRALFEHAKDRFGDVKWVDGDGDDHEEVERLEDGYGMVGGRRTREGSVRTQRGQTDEIFAHKAVVYARAPKGFKDRYFTPSNPLSSPSLLRINTSSPSPPSYVNDQSTTSLHEPNPPGPSVQRPRITGDKPDRAQTPLLRLQTQHHNQNEQQHQRNRVSSTKKEKYGDTLSGSPIIGIRVSSLPDAEREGEGEINSNGRSVSRNGSYLTAPGSSTISTSATATATNANPILELSNQNTPELIRANLEWLYTSEGMGGDVVEWLNGEEIGIGNGSCVVEGAGGLRDGGMGGAGLVGLGVGILDGFGDSGRRGDGAKKTRRRLSRLGDEVDRHEKLSQDMVYMWRSKLYSDIKIRLQINPTSPKPTYGATTLAPPTAFHPTKARTSSRHSSRTQNPTDGRASVTTSFMDDSDAEYDDPRDKNGNVMAFSAHRFMLCSRSPYFAQVLLNSSAFAYHPAGGSTTSVNKAQIPEILLPTPPFTPIALHFVLGYIYSGSLDFSHRSFELNTAFAVYRAAIFLEIDALLAEVEARIIWDFCDGMPLIDTGRPGDSNRKKRARRIPRLWRFALAPDVGAVALGMKAAAYVVKFWGDCLGREVATVEESVRNRMLERITDGMVEGTVVAGYESLLACRQRFDAEGTASWLDEARGMVQEIESDLQRFLLRNVESIFAHTSFVDLLDPMRSKAELLNTILDSLATGCDRPDLCEQAPQVYQAIVGSLLTGTKQDSEELLLAPGSRYREDVEKTKRAVLGHVKRRWMHIKSAKAFNGLEYWALKEISDEIDVEVQDLLEPDRKLRVSSRSQASVVPEDALKPSPSNGRVAALKTRQIAVAPSPGSLAAAARLRSISLASLATVASTTPPAAASTSTRVVNGRRSTPAAPVASATATRTSVGVPPGPSSRVQQGPKPLQLRAETSSIRSARSTIDGNRAATPTNGVAGPSAPTRATPSAIAGPSRTGAGLATKKPDAAISRVSTSPSRIGVVAVRIRTLSALSTTSMLGTNAGGRASPAGARLPVTTKQSAVPSRLANDSSSIRSVASQRGPGGAVIVRETATSRARAALGSNVEGGATAKESDTRSQKANSIRSVATGRSIGTNVRPKTPVAGPSRTKPTSPVRPVPPMPASEAIRPGRPLAKEGSVTSLKTLRLKPIPKSGSSISLASRQRTKSEANPSTTPKTPTKAKSTLKTAWPSPLQKVPSPPKGSSKEASASTDGDASEAMTPVGSDTECLQTPHIVREGSGESEAAFGPTLDELLGSRPTDRRILGKSSFRKPSLPLPADSRSYDRSSIRIRAASTTSSMHSHSHPAHAFDPPARPPTSPAITVSDDNASPGAESGVGLQVGIPCIVALSERKARFKALCRYIGRLNDTPGPWVGVEIAEYVGVKYGLEGLSDGSVGGVRYFNLTAIEADVGARRPSESSRPPSRRSVARKISMPSSSIGRAHAARDDGPLSASWAESFDHSTSISRSASPAAVTRDANNPAHWIQGAFGPANGRTRSLFVQPSEVVFVLGAAE